jgi:hypothetical protein
MEKNEKVDSLKNTQYLSTYFIQIVINFWLPRFTNLNCHPLCPTSIWLIRNSLLKNDYEVWFPL